MKGPRAPRQNHIEIHNNWVYLGLHPIANTGLQVFAALLHWPPGIFGTKPGGIVGSGNDYRHGRGMAAGLEKETGKG